MKHVPVHYVVLQVSLAEAVARVRTRSGAHTEPLNAFRLDLERCADGHVA